MFENCGLPPAVNRLEAHDGTVNFQHRIYPRNFVGSLYLQEDVVAVVVVVLVVVVVVVVVVVTLMISMIRD